MQLFSKQKTRQQLKEIIYEGLNASKAAKEIRISGKKDIGVIVVLKQ